ncbi:MAG: DUF1353 domain-containing protein [Phycisphaerae bacterium]|nr:DUF1353 domain-containing protein [Phycisphaerae bacterium]
MMAWTKIREGLREIFAGDSPHPYTSFVHSVIQVEELGWRDGRPWHRLLTPVTLEWQINGESWRIVVPAGFETDYATTPRALWWLVPPNGPWLVPAIGHDWLYRRGRISRFFADAAFRDAMAAEGVAPWQRVLMYYAVRLCGGRHYRRSRT